MSIDLGRFVVMGFASVLGFYLIFEMIFLLFKKRMGTILLAGIGCLRGYFLAMMIFIGIIQGLMQLGKILISHL